MLYRERLNIVIMRDNGPRHSYHLKRSNFVLLLLFFLCLPFLAILLSSQCYMLWQENVKLRESLERAEADYQAMESKAERLENLEELLKEENVPGREVVIRQLGSVSKPEKPSEEKESPEEAQPEQFTEGPGHEEFPALDTGRVIVSNVQARAMRGNSLRVGLDLRNPDNEPLLSGDVDAILLTANAERINLKFAPDEVGSFRISRFKRTLITAQVPRNVSLVNAQIILEVKDQDAKPIYRNIFAVQR